MSNKYLKPKKDSLFEFNKKYANNPEECARFFIQAKYNGDFTCNHCGCHKYYLISHKSEKTGKISFKTECANKDCKYQESILSHTVFQDCKLDLYKLLLGIFLFFTENKGVTASCLRSALDVNYKSASLLLMKCRSLMTLSNCEKKLKSLFLESDVFTIGTPSKEKRGKSTEQQEVFMTLSTEKENRYPEYIKLTPINDYKGSTYRKCLEKAAVLSPEVTLNTDGDSAFNALKDIIHVKNMKVDYEKKNHRLKWLNIIIGNIKNNILGIYHGISKRELPLYLNEQEYRFNHRNTGTNMMAKVQKYIGLSYPLTHKMITRVLDTALEQNT